eukprot:Nitzschia sp. Nitz4//scaffold59_size112058//92722//95440//NITZ4_004125-RA/size112058-snap-gene-0.53-mRNA-1//1//CDS//3329555171//7483//frame0
MLAHAAVSVVFEGTEVVRASSLRTLPVSALGSLPLDLGSNCLGQEVVLVLGVIVSKLPDDRLLDEVLPATLLGKVDGVLGVAEVERSVAAHGVGRGVPAHEGVLPSLSDCTVVVEADLPELLRVERRLVGSGPHLLDDDHARAAVRHLLRDQVGRVQRGDLGGVVGKNGVGEPDARVVDHGEVLLGHFLQLALQGWHIRSFGFPGLHQSLLHGDYHGAVTCGGSATSQGSDCARSTEQTEHLGHYREYYLLQQTWSALDWTGRWEEAPRLGSVVADPKSSTAYLRRCTTGGGKAVDLVDYHRLPRLQLDNPKLPQQLQRQHDNTTTRQHYSYEYSQCKANVTMATTDKYDRQLRLWGAQGQRALGETHVFLIGASAAGTETLKNLVLPGIGSFSVMDDAITTKQDASSNFFLPSSTVGKPRAEVAADFLSELNPDVVGTFHHLPSLDQADWNEILGGSGKKRVLVVASDLTPSLLETLSALCTSLSYQLLVVHSYGLIGTVRVQVPGVLPLLDPKPTNAHPDLRLKSSFPALNALSDSIQLDSLESHEHGHVPYPILLLKAREKFGKLPTTFAEKQDFVKVLQSMRRSDMELNFDEAIQNAYLAYTEPTVTVPDQFDASSTVGILFRGYESFVQSNGGRPPLNGSIPDMTSSTEWYIQLQSIYKTQADNDRAAMKALCPGVPDDDLNTFCANVFTVDQMQTRSLVDEFHSKGVTEDMVDDWKMALMDPYEVPEHTPLLWYLGLRACQVFCQLYGRYPGCMPRPEDDFATDVPLLQQCWQTVLQQYQLHDQELLVSHAASICQEMTRYANAELHTIASVVGGVASQEAVKLITGQYIPLDNTYIFNGIVSVAGVYKF